MIIARIPTVGSMVRGVTPITPTEDGKNVTIRLCRKMCSRGIAFRRVESTDIRTSGALRSKCQTNGPETIGLMEAHGQNANCLWCSLNVLTTVQYSTVQY